MGFLFCPPKCPKRTVGCHSWCKDYKDRKAEYERLKAKDDKEREARTYVATMNRMRRDRLAKRRHVQSGKFL